MSVRRYSDSRVVHGEGKSSVDIKIERAAEMERWARREEHYAGGRYVSPGDRAEARKWAEKWRREAAALVESAIREEAESAADPARFTGFEIRTPRSQQTGRALPSWYAGKGGAATTRRQGKRRRG